MDSVCLHMYVFQKETDLFCECVYVCLCVFKAFIFCFCTDSAELLDSAELPTLIQVL